MRLSDTIVKTNSNGDSTSPWSTPLWIFTSTMFLLQQSISLFSFSWLIIIIIDFSIRFELWFFIEVSVVAHFLWSAEHFKLFYLILSEWSELTTTKPGLEIASVFVHVGHCWRSRDELISDVLLLTPTYGRAKAGRPARTCIQQLCGDTECSPEDLPEVMNDREKWRERVRDIRAGGTTWWWWWLVTLFSNESDLLFLHSLKWSQVLASLPKWFSDITF